MPPRGISAEDVKRRIDSGERIVLMDARSPDEWDSAGTQLKGSLRLVPSEVENHLRFIPRCPVVKYDASAGVCASRAAGALIENGWRDVHPMEGGFAAGERAGLGTEARASGPVNEKS